jgi:hypothetical protein
MHFLVLYLDTAWLLAGRDLEEHTHSNIGPQSCYPSPFRDSRLSDSGIWLALYVSVSSSLLSRFISSPTTPILQKCLQTSLLLVKYSLLRLNSSLNGLDSRLILLWALSKYSSSPAATCGLPSAGSISCQRHTTSRYLETAQGSAQQYSDTLSVFGIQDIEMSDLPPLPDLIRSANWTTGRKERSIDSESESQKGRKILQDEEKAAISFAGNEAHTQSVSSTHHERLQRRPKKAFQWAICVDMLFKIVIILSVCYFVAMAIYLHVMLSGAMNSFDDAFDWSSWREASLRTTPETGTSDGSFGVWGVISFAVAAAGKAVEGWRLEDRKVQQMGALESHTALKSMPQHDHNHGHEISDPNAGCSCGHDDGQVMTRLVRRMQPGAVEGKVGPRKALEWGQLNFLVSESR